MRYVKGHHFAGLAPCLYQPCAPQPRGEAKSMILAAVIVKPTKRLRSSAPRPVASASAHRGLRSPEDRSIRINSLSGCIQANKVNLVAI